jgi:hypothetical protein
MPRTAQEDLQRCRNGLHKIRAHKVISVYRHNKLEPGIGANNPAASKDLAEATQLYFTNRRRERDYVLDPFAWLELARQFEQNARRTDIECFPAARCRQAANLGNQYWQTQSVSLCTSLIQASNVRDERHDGNG